MKLPQGDSGAAFSMVGQHCFGSQPQLTTDASLKDAVCRLKDAGRPWTTVSGYANVLRALAQSSRHADKLLGADEETKTQARPLPTISLRAAWTIHGGRAWHTTPGSGARPPTADVHAAKHTSVRFLAGHGVAGFPRLGGGRHERRQAAEGELGNKMACLILM